MRTPSLSQRLTTQEGSGVCIAMLGNHDACVLLRQARARLLLQLPAVSSAPVFPLCFLSVMLACHA